MNIGTGLFVGSGRSLAQGGPLSVVIGFLLIGIMLYCTVHALGEMAVAFPVAGSFSAYSTRFLDPAWGFAMGWNYAMQWLVALPLETVSASIVIKYWNTSVPTAAWITMFLFIIISINLFGVRGYGEAEFVFSIIKVVAVIGFILLGVIINIGGGPGGSYIGSEYWRNPGPFNNGFRGLCSVFVNAAFAFAGTELVGLAAAETANPRKTLPTAVKQVFWRICIFYLVSLTVVGLIVRSNDRMLVGSDSPSDTRASPFVIAIKNAGIQGMDSIMNTVILVAVLSVGNSAVYGSSRTLAALAEQGQAPKILGYIDQQGRPLVAILTASFLGLLAYMGCSSKQAETFNWLISLSGLSSLFTWGSICLAHIRFRKAWAANGRGLDELAFTSQPGVIGSWIGFLFNVALLISQFWVGFQPIGYENNSTRDNIVNFLQSYMAAPIVLLFYISYKIKFNTPFMKVGDMDIRTGMRELNLTNLLREERLEQAEWPRWKRWYKLLC